MKTENPFAGIEMPRWTLYAAIAAAVLGAIADTLLLYNEQGGYETGHFGFMAAISPARLLAGLWLGVLAIPFEALGLFYLYFRITGADWRRFAYIPAAGLYMVAVGVTVHGVLGVIGLAMQTPATAAATANYQAALNPLSGVLVTLHLLVTALFIVRLRKAAFPAYLLWLNPVTLYLVLAATYWIAPPLGRFLFPAAFNLSYGLFFLLAALSLRQSNAR